MLKQTVTSLLQDGLNAHGAGDLKKAESVYRQILQMDSGNPDAWHLLGLIAYQVGQAGEAVKLMQQALESRPNDTTYLNNIGSAYVSLGRDSDAEKAYRAAIQSDEENSDAHYNLGTLLKRVGDSAGAELEFRKAVNLAPKNVSAWNNLGNLYRAAGEDQRALVCYDEALKWSPDMAETLNNKGVIFAARQDFEEAIKLYRKAMELQPEYLPAIRNLGDILLQRDNLDDAATCYLRAIGVAPQDWSSWHKYGVTLKRTGRSNQALECFRRAIQLNSTEEIVIHDMAVTLFDLRKYEETELMVSRLLEMRPDLQKYQNMYAICQIRIGRSDKVLAILEKLVSANSEHIATYRSNYGSALKGVGRRAEAEKAYLQALDTEPTHVEALYNLGVIVGEDLRIDEARNWYKKTISADPTYALAYWNLSLLELSIGNFEEGLDLYEWRWRWREFPTAPRVWQDPAWQGEDLAGKRILVHAEQGLGDTIQFCRYWQELKLRGAYVIAEVQKPLRGLLSCADGVDELYAYGEQLPRVDYQIPLLSLPRVFQTRLDSIPARVPYVHADQEWLDNTKLQKKGQELLVGLCWQGNREYGGDKERSPGIEPLLPLLTVPGVRFVALQRDGRSTLLERSAGNVIDLGHDIDTGVQPFTETAAVMSQLDLIISSDTAIPHLAGALGCKTWLMLCWAPDYRWLYEREDSPWYPTMRLFRQTERNNWNGVIERMRTQLIEMVKEISE